MSRSSDRAVQHAPGDASQARSGWDLRAEPWMEADHRGVTALEGGTGAHGNGRGLALPAPGAGQRLPADVQARMDEAFATDFSAVRVHESAAVRSMGALAYARGTDIHFAPGQYAPHSRRGQELLGHELAHVIQQAQGRVAATAQARGVAVNEDPALEREADDMGARAARGERVNGRSMPLTPVQLHAPIQYMKITTDAKYGGAQIDTQTELDRLKKYLKRLVDDHRSDLLLALKTAVASEPATAALVGTALGDALMAEEEPPKKPAAKAKPGQTAPAGGKKKKAKAPGKPPAPSKEAIRGKIVDLRVDACENREVLAALLSRDELGLYGSYLADHDQLLSAANKVTAQNEQGRRSLNQEVDDKLGARHEQVKELEKKYHAVIVDPGKVRLLHVYGADGVPRMNDDATVEALGSVSEMLQDARLDGTAILRKVVPVTKLPALAGSVAKTPGFANFLRTYQIDAIDVAVKANGNVVELSAAREALQRESGIEYVAHATARNDTSQEGRARKEFAIGASQRFDTFFEEPTKESLTHDQKLKVMGKQSTESFTNDDWAKFRSLTPASTGLSPDEEERLQTELDSEANKLRYKVVGTMQLVLKDGTAVKDDLQIFVSGGLGSSDYSYGPEQARARTGQGTGALANFTYPVMGQSAEAYRNIDPRHTGHHGESREFDAEVKILEQTIGLLQAQQQANKEIAGATLRLYVSRYACPSCSDMMYKAKQDHPILKKLGKIEVIYQGSRQD